MKCGGKSPHTRRNGSLDRKIKQRPKRVTLDGNIRVQSVEAFFDLLMRCQRKQEPDTTVEVKAEEGD